YRHEIRIIKNNKNIFSYRDAQGFRKKPNQKLRVKLIDAYIYHYGWVREPAAMQRKQRAFSALYHDNDWVEKHMAKANEFDYSNVDSLELFTENHPAVMLERIARKNWKFDHDVSKKNYNFKEKLKRVIGFRVGEYKNYKII
ncbi:MAG: glycosyltransferase family 2 protein, partial [Cytophagales bacterium]